MTKKISIIIGIAILAVLLIGVFFVGRYVVDSFDEDWFYSAPQSQASYQGYVKYENGACATHIVNVSTNEDVILKEEKTDDPASCDFCQIKSFSPDYQYVIEDCGTSPARGLAIIDRLTKKQITVSSYGGYGWLNNYELAFTDADGQERNCIQGSQPEIAKVNLSTGEKSALKQADNTHSYYIKQVSDNSISYLVTTYSKSVYGNDCNFTTDSSDAIMDGSGL